MFIVGILGYKIGQEIKANKNFVEGNENYNNEESIESAYNIEKDYLKKKSAAEKYYQKDKAFLDIIVV